MGSCMIEARGATDAVMDENIYECRQKVSEWDEPIRVFRV
jgi:hypothetical protein